MKLEVVQLSVADVDATRDFYAERIGFTLDMDRMVPGGLRIVQLTPPGSGCSIKLAEGSGALSELTLVVSDVMGLHAELTSRGAPVSEVVHYKDGEQLPGYSDEPWSSMLFFADPDGNRWTVQERPAR